MADDENIPRGVCTASTMKRGICKCSHFKSDPNSPMYCAQPNCGHSVEWHHLSAREVDA